jgi:hypothetical protein
MALITEFRTYAEAQRQEDAERKMQERKSDLRWYIGVLAAIIFATILSFLNYCR